MAPASLTEFGSLAVKNATRLVSAAKVEKEQGLDPIKLSFQGHFFLDSKLQLGQCFSGFLPSQASLSKSDRTGEFSDALKDGWFSVHFHS